MATLPLPPAKVQFFDNAGKPLNGGFVFHYVPGTSTLANTYQDYDGITPNPNPVPLDSVGMARIFGDGKFRQVVTDRLGNQIWDANTDTAQTTAGLPLAGGTLTGTLTVPGLVDTGGQSITVTPTGDAVTTLTSLSVTGTTLSTITREYLGVFALISNKRNGAAGAVTPTAALYTGIQGQAGTSDIWSHRISMVQDAASGTYNAIAHEIDVTNNVAARGAALGAAGLSAPVTYGVAYSGLGAFPATAAVLVTGNAQTWARGLVIANNSVVQTSVQDLGNSTISYEIQGTHTYGIDAKSANMVTFARIGQGQFLKSRDVGDTVDIKMMVYSGTQLLIGDTTSTAIGMSNHTFPVTDNAYTIGANGFRWSAIWSANGVIQTSDPALKTDIAPLADLRPEQISDLVAGIAPIRFRWASGGKDADENDIPGKRQHWGWDAANVKATFDALGQDFGGFVQGEDGTQHLRPDQLVPVLWRAVQLLTARIDALEGIK